MPRNPQPQQRKTPKKQEIEVQKSSSMLQIVTALAILAVGIYRAIDRRWVSDDAYITFRYVKNFLAGNGLVYNIGERVEGYTHFLWLMLIAAAQSFGADPTIITEWLGIASFAATLCILILISFRETKLAHRATFFPVAAALLALNYDMAVWATGGLETSFFAFLILLALYLWFYSSLKETNRLVSVGGVLFLATLTRPDGALFIATVLSLMLYRDRKRGATITSSAKSALLFLLPSLLLGIPYLLWKLSYYGDILPNTYYAKSADHSYFGQGAFYVWLFFKVYFSSAVVMVAFAFWHWRSGKRMQPDQLKLKHSPASGLGSPLAGASIGVSLYLVLFVMRSGGDFMFARFVIPVLPLIYFIVERALDRLPRPLSRFSLIFCLVLVLAVLGENQWRESVLFHTNSETAQLEGNWDGKAGGETRGIADERWVYMRKRFNLNGVERGSLDVYSDIGRYYESFFRGLPVKVAISGAQNSIAYYANFPTVIDQYGLTDSYIAHLPIKDRGRMGHEKEAPEEYLEKRGVNFELFAVTPEFPKTTAYNLAVFEIPQYGIWQLVKIIDYDSAIVGELSRRFLAEGNRSVMPRFNLIIPSYLDKLMPTLSREQVAEDYKGFKKIYLDKYPNATLQKRFEDFINAPVRDTTHA